MANKARKLNYQVEFEFNSKQVKAEMESINRLLDTSKHNEIFSEEDTKELKEILSNLQSVNGLLEKMGDGKFIDPKSFQTSNKVVVDLQKQLNSLTKKVIKDFAGKDFFNNENIQQYNDKLAEAEGNLKNIKKELDSLESQQERLQGFKKDPKSAILESIKTAAKGQKQSTYIGEGTPFGKIEDIKDAADVLETARKEIIKIEAAIEKIDKSNRSDDSKDKAMQPWNNKLAVYKEIIALLTDERGENIKIQEQIEEQRKELEKQETLVRNINAEKAEAERVFLEDPELNAGMTEVQNLNHLSNDEVERKLAEARGQLERNAEAAEETAEANKKLANSNDKVASSMDGFLGKFISSQIIFQKLKQLYRETIRTVKELDAAFNGIAIVTSYSTKEVWNMYDSFQTLAKNTGFTVKEISNLSLEYFRQGRALSEVIKLTEAAASAARIAGISAEESVRYLTAAVNGYRMAADQAMMVSDKFAALAAASATDYDGLATALSKVAAQAYTVGVEMDSMLGYIAKVLEVTQEAPENIGTAFKTIFARMSEIKDFGVTLEDGMSINRVESALSSVGVALRDTSGEVRDLDDVLNDLGEEWNSLTKNQKSYIATAVAGTRQQSRFLALMEDYDRTMELVEASSNSLGATYAQQAIYTEGLAFAQNQLNVAWEGFITSLTNTDAIIVIFNLLTGVVETVSNLVEGMNELPGIIQILIGAVTIATVASLAFLKALQNTAIAQKLVKNSILEYDAGLKQLIITIIATTAGMGAEAAATATLGVALDALKKKMWELFTTMTFGHPYLALVIAGMAAFTAVTVTVVKSIKTADEQLSELNEEIKKTQAELHKQKDKKTQITQLIEDTQELSNKLFKTNEELETINSNLEKLKDLGIDIDIHEINNEDFIAELLAGIDEAIEETEKELEKQAEKGKKLVLENHKKFSQLDQSMQSSLIISSTRELKKMSEFSNTKVEILEEASEKFWKANLALDEHENNLVTQTIKERESLLESKKAELETALEVHSLDYYEQVARHSRNSSIDYNPQLTQEAEHVLQLVEDISSLDSEVTKLKGSVKEVFSLEDSAEALELWESLTKGVDLNNLTMEEAVEIYNAFTEQIDMTKEGAEEFMTLVDSSYSAVAKFANILTKTDVSNNIFTVTVEDLQYLEKQLRKLDFSDLEIEKVFEIVAQEGDLRKAAQYIIKNYKNLGLSAENAYDALNQINEINYGNAEETISRLATGMQSAGQRMQDFKDAVTGGWDINTIFEITKDYPELWETLSNGAEVSAEEIEAAFKDIETSRKNDLTSAVNHYKDSLQIQIAEAEAEQNFLIEMLEYYNTASEEEKTAIENFIQEKYNLNIKGYEADLKAYKSYLTTKASYDKKFEEAKWYLRQGGIDQYNAKIAELAEEAGFDAIDEIDFSDGEGDGQTDAVEAYLAAKQKQIEALKNQYAAFSNTEAVVNLITQKATSAFKEGSDAAEEYEAKLNELYIIQQKMAQNDARLEFLSVIVEDETLSAEQLSAIYKEQAKLYQENAHYHNEMVKEIQSQMDETKAAIEGYGDGLFEFSSAGAIPVLEKLDELSKKGGNLREKVEDLAETYNELTSEMWDNQTAALEDEKAWKELEDTLEEAAKNAEKDYIKAQAAFDNMLLEEYKAYLAEKHKADIKAKEEKKKLLEEQFEEEKKALEARKKLYEDFFNTEDQQNELNDIDAKRQSIMSQLSSLEGATDNNSVQKRQKLLDELDDLNKDFSEKLTDINREALLETLDEEIKVKEESNQKEIELIDKDVAATEEAYEKMIENSAKLLEEFKKKAGENWDEQKAWLEKYSIAYNLATEAQKQEMMYLWEETRNEVIATEEEYKKADALWKAYQAGAREEINSTSGSMTNFKGEIDNVNTALGETKQAVEDIGTSTVDMVNQVKQPYTNLISWSGSVAANAQAAASAQATFVTETWKAVAAIQALNLAKEDATENAGDKVQEKYTGGKKNANVDYVGGIEHFATGGSTQRTGWHWLDGKPGKPERVLSAQQTEAFDKLVDSITNNNNITNAGVSIGSIKIETPQLNANQDFVTAGRALADALSEAIASRGININQKK